jgi:hypothetical protein
VEGKLGNLITANARVFLRLRHRLESGSINYFVNGFDGALDLLSGELETIISAFEKRRPTQPKHAGFEAG